MPLSTRSAPSNTLWVLDSKPGARAAALGPGVGGGDPLGALSSAASPDAPPTFSQLSPLPVPRRRPGPLRCSPSPPSTTSPPHRLALARRPARPLPTPSPARAALHWACSVAWAGWGCEATARALEPGGKNEEEHSGARKGAPAGYRGAEGPGATDKPRLAGRQVKRAGTARSFVEEPSETPALRRGKDRAPGRRRGWAEWRQGGGSGGRGQAGGRGPELCEGAWRPAPIGGGGGGAGTSK